MSWDVCFQGDIFRKPTSSDIEKNTEMPLHLAAITLSVPGLTSLKNLGAFQVTS
jgi:hypothetical protein